MNVKLYQNTAEAVRVNKTAYLTETVTASGTPIPPLDVERPSILIKRENVNDYNYCYIDAYSRYYFIVGKSWQGENVWQLTVEEDYLMSWKTGIGNLEAFVTRSQSNGNEYFFDDRATVQEKMNKNMSSFVPKFADRWESSIIRDLSVEPNVIHGHLCLGVMCSSVEVSQNGTVLETFTNPTGVTYFICTYSGFTQFITAIKNQADFNIDTMSKVIREAFWVPYKIISGVNGFVTKVSFATGIGGSSINISEGLMKACQKTNLNCGIDSIEWTANFVHTGSKYWENAEPLTHLGLYFEPFGMLNFNTNNYAYRNHSPRIDGITLRVEYEPYTGKANLYAIPKSTDDVYAYEKYREKLGQATLRFDFSIQYLLNNADVLQYTMLSSIATSVLSGSMGGLAKQEYLHAAGSAAAAGLSAYASALPTMYNSPMRTIGGQSGTQLFSDPKLIETWYDYTKPYPSLAGEKANINAVLSTLSGYTEVAYVHVENIQGLLKSEADAIEQLLKTGVIL